MRQFLLLMLLLCASFGSKAQVILNEFYTAASSGTAKQFLELYNSGNTPVDLSCYSLVSLGMNNSGVINSINIIDFPDGAIIAAKAHYTAGNGPNTTLGSVYNVDYNWSSTTQPTGASLKRFTVTGNNISQPVTNPGDFFITNNGNIKVAVFLFDGSTKSITTNAASYIDGFVAYGNLTGTIVPAVPTSFNFATRPDFINPTSACSPSVIRWSNVNVSEYSNQAAGGNSHGYYRAANGQCGTWNKVSNDNLFSPNKNNPLSTSISNSGSGALNTVESFTCNSSQIQFGIQNTQNVQFPIKVELYYDNNNDGYLDASEFQTSIESITTLPYLGSFNIQQGTKPVLAYKTALGCASKVVAVSALPFDIGFSASYCNGLLDYKFTGTSSNNVLLYPLELGIYPAKNGVLDSDTVGSQIQKTSINTALPSIQSYTLNAPLLTQFAVVVKSTNACQPVSVLYFTNNTADLKLSTMQRMLYSPASGVQFAVTAVANPIFAHQVLPFKIELFADNPVSSSSGVIGAIDQTDVEFSPAPNTFNQFFGSAPSVQYQTTFLPTANETWPVLVRYSTNGGCITQTEKLSNILPVKFSYFTAQRNPDNNKQVQLDWQTSIEQNNKGFYIQRMNGGEWQDMAFIPTAALGGNSNVPLKYHYEEVNLFSSTTYYRMYQVDFDGRSDYSEVKSVAGAEPAKSRMVVFPNPGQGGRTTVVFASENARHILLSDASGQLIKQWRNYTGSRLSLIQLKPGFYTLKVWEGDGAVPAVEKIIIH